MSVKDLLVDTPLYTPLRTIYRCTIHRSSWREVRAMRALYGVFIKRDDLVFDVGANIGEYAEVFSQLGKKVVAFEPNPACLVTLRRVAKRCRQIAIEECAIGDAPGVAQMNICDLNHYGTMNDEFLAETSGSEDYKDAHWTGKIEVPVSTLDEMRDRHGVPAFVKIDVEGFEAHVVRGMSFRPKTLTFEFSTRSKHIAYEVLDRLGDDYLFNAVAGRSFDFVHPRWMSRQQIADWLHGYTATQYGDIFASVLPCRCHECQAPFGVHYANCPKK